MNAHLREQLKELRLTANASCDMPIFSRRARTALPNRSSMDSMADSLSA